MIQNKHIIFIFRIVLGGVFIWAGIFKIFDPIGFAKDIANYRIFPHGMSFFLALIMPWIEVICGVFLIVGIYRASNLLILSSILAAFLFLIAITILRGFEIDCGCFGIFSRKVDYKLILLDSALLFFSLSIFSYEKRKDSKIEIIKKN